MFTIHLLRGMVFGFYAFTAFCPTVALSLPAMGIAAGITLALCFSLAVHVRVLWSMGRTRRRIHARTPEQAAGASLERCRERYVGKEQELGR